MPKPFVKITLNLLNNPYEEKFKILKKSNEKIKNEILSFNGTLIFLTLLGFEDNNFGILNFNKEISIKVVREASIILQSKINLLNSSNFDEKEKNQLIRI